MDSEAVKRGEEGQFCLFNLCTGEMMEQVPPNRKVRVKRERLRTLLMEGIDVEVCMILSPTFLPERGLICGE